MQITYQGTEYQFDKDKITVDEWRELKRKYKMTPKAFEDGISEADPDASTFAWWVILRQAGDQRTPLNDDLKPDIIELNHAIAVAVQAEADAEERAAREDPDPTPAGSPPGTPTPARPGSSKATSGISGTSTSSSSPGSAASDPGT